MAERAKPKTCRRRFSMALYKGLGYFQMPGQQNVIEIPVTIHGDNTRRQKPHGFISRG